MISDNDIDALIEDFINFVDSNQNQSKKKYWVLNQKR